MLGERAGAGAMGEVWIGDDEALGRRAAIKFLATQHLRSAVTRERFLREARALARLSHPNLITVYEAGEWEGRPYFAMELLEGGDALALMAERGDLPSAVVASLGAQAAAGLAEAARNGIVHRDVKPSNLGLSARGLVKVTDFGLAKSLSLEASLTGKGLVVGTADYIAPEQARGEELDERADVYSLGCTLFHLHTGLPPFRRDLGPGRAVQEYVEIIREHLRAPVPDLRERAVAADPRLAELLGSAMAKSPSARPSLSRFGQELGAIAARLSGQIPCVTHTRFSATREAAPGTDPEAAPTDLTLPDGTAGPPAPARAVARPEPAASEAAGAAVDAPGRPAGGGTARRPDPDGLRWYHVVIVALTAAVAAMGYLLVQRG